MKTFFDRDPPPELGGMAMLIALVALIMSLIAFMDGCSANVKEWESDTESTTNVDTDTDNDIDTDTDSDVDTDTSSESESDIDTDTDSDGDNDGGTGTDSDTDTDSDTVTDPLWVGCDGEPLTCYDIGPDKQTQFFGCCWDNVVYWCNDPKLLRSNDCNKKGLECLVKYWKGEAQYMWCLEGGE